MRLRAEAQHQFPVVCSEDGCRASGRGSSQALLATDSQLPPRPPAPVQVQGTSVCCPGPFLLDVFPVASRLEVVTQRCASSLYLLLSTSFLPSCRPPGWPLATPDSSRLGGNSLHRLHELSHSGPGLPSSTTSTAPSLRPWGPHTAEAHSHPRSWVGQ